MGLPLSVIVSKTETLGDTQSRDLNFAETTVFE